MLRSKFKVFRDSRIAIDLTFSLRGEEYFKAGNLQFIVTLTRITFVVSLICPLYDQEDFGDVHFKAFHFMININFKAGNLQFIVTLTRITFVVSLICPLYDQEDFGDVHFKAFHFMININSSREKKATRKPLLNMVIFAVRRSEGTHYKTKRVSFQCQWFVTFDFSFLFDSLLISR